MSKKLYVGNISFRAREEDLRDEFAKIGEVLSAKIITDPETGRSKGFGFVEMANDEDGQKAMTSLNGLMFLDRALVVNEARPRPERTGGPRGGGGGRGGGRGGMGGGGGRDFGRRRDE